MNKKKTSDLCHEKANSLYPTKDDSRLTPARLSAICALRRRAVELQSEGR